MHSWRVWLLDARLDCTTEVKDGIAAWRMAVMWPVAHRVGAFALPGGKARAQGHDRTKERRSHRCSLFSLLTSCCILLFSGLGVSCTAKRKDAISILLVTHSLRAPASSPSLLPPTITSPNRKIEHFQPWTTSATSNERLRGPGLGTYKHGFQDGGDVSGLRSPLCRSSVRGTSWWS